MSDPKTNKFKANWNVGCQNCELKPTVDVVTKNKSLVSRSELCGPCFFGESAMLDTSEWDNT